MKLYIAGPMTGIENFNYPAFHRAETELVAAGYEVLNPAMTPVQSSWLGYMRAALRQVAACDGIATLHGWEHSKGAKLEVDVVTRLGLPVQPIGVWSARAEVPAS